MQKGWSAKGLLQPLWGRVGGRDRLAEITGINTSTLSGINTGRLNLGKANAERLAEALEVSLLELGAPVTAAADPASQQLLDRLEELSVKLADSLEVQAKLTRQVTSLQGRVRKLEAQHAPAVAAPSNRRRGAAN